jgi:general stress protein YciG
MSKSKVKEIAAMGGKASGGNFKHNPERARQAGRKGGQSSTP